MQALTHSERDSIFTIGFFPKDDRFLYTADQGGNELNHIYVRNADGSSHDLTAGENLKARFSGWSNDDTKFYLATNERDPKFFDMYEYQVDGFERELIFKNEDGYIPGGISPDGQLLTLLKVQTRDDSDVYVYDRKNQSTRCVTEHTGDINHSPMDFTPDGEHLIIGTDKGSEFQYLVQIDLATGARKELDPKFDWDVVGGRFSKHGKFFQITINEDAKTRVMLFEYPAMKQVKLPTIEAPVFQGIGVA